jgi:hydroxyacylglutathione hydrolase
MEEYNLNGSAPALDRLPQPPPMDPQAFDAAIRRGALAIDLRSPEAYAGAFVPQSLAIPLPMVPAFAGYFVPYDQDMVLVASNFSDIEMAVRHFIRLGFDRTTGFLAPGLHGWETSGLPYDRIPAVHVDELVRRIKAEENFTLLDVREKSEIKQTGMLPGAMHIFLGDLPEQIDKVPRDKPVTTFCGSGQRAIIAASILKQKGYKEVEDSLGSMAACISGGCPVEKKGG